MQFPIQESEIIAAPFPRRAHVLVHSHFPQTPVAEGDFLPFKEPQVPVAPCSPSLGAPSS